MKKNILAFLVLAMAFTYQVLGQDRVITGEVRALETGDALPGVTVLVKGTSTGTVTDLDGAYRINVASDEDVLIFSFIGLKSEEVVVGSRSVVDVSMQDDVTQLTEVVVTAMGIQRKTDELTYSVKTMEGDEINTIGALGPAGSFAGKVSGLQINTSSGAVNASTRVTLRGNRSLLGNNQPLYVIDGLPIDNSSNMPGTGVLDNVDVGNRINDINPNDIASMTILKGATAAALYGSRAANGAIIITTKSGDKAAGKPRVQLNSQVTYSDVLFLPAYQDRFGAGYDLETYTANENTSWGPEFDGTLRPVGPTLADGSVQMLRYSPIEDNISSFYETGVNLTNSVSVSGGNERSTYFISYSHADISGIIPKDRFDRNTFRLNLGQDLGDKVRISLNTAYNKNTQDVSFGTNVYEAVVNTPKNVRLSDYKDWRNTMYATPNTYYSGYYVNPYWELDNNRFVSDLDRIIGSMELTYKPLNWLNIVARVGTDTHFDRRKFYKAKYLFTHDYQRPNDLPGEIENTTLFTSETTSDFIATANADINKDLSFTFMMGHNTRQRIYRSVLNSASAIVIPDFYDISNRVGEPGADEASSVRRLMGVWSDLTLNYKDYLFLNITGRNDWSSTLPQDKNSFFYPSTGLSFVFSEAFPALTSNIFTYGKLGASYSRVGLDADPYLLTTNFSISDYPTPRSITPGSFPFGGTPGFQLGNTVASPVLNPEFTTSLEFNLQLNMVKDLLAFDVTYFQSNSTDQIVSIGVAPSSGYNRATVNAGSIENNGWEIDLKAIPVSLSNGLTWEVGISYYKVESRVMSLYGDAKQLPIGSGDPVPTAIVGELYPVLLGSGWERDPEGRVVVDASTGYPEVSGGLINFGTANPTDIVGLNTGLSYKGLKLTATADYRTGHVFYSGTARDMAFTGGHPATVVAGRQSFIWPNSVIEVSDGVYQPNENVVIRDGGFGFWGNYWRGVAEPFVIDATALKLRQVSLSYQLPKQLLSKALIKDATITLAGNNLLMFLPEENQFADPEASFVGDGAPGREYLTIPSTRSYGASVSLTF